MPRNADPVATRATPVRAELELRALLDAAVDAVIVIDHTGQIETFNPAAERLFGYRAVDTIGRDVSMLMPEPDRSRHGGYLREYLRTGVGRIIGIGRDVVAQRSDGARFPVALSVGAIAGTEPPRYVAFIHDISAHRAALEALQKSESQLRAAQAIASLGDFEVRGPESAVHWSQ